MCDRCKKEFEFKCDICHIRITCEAYYENESSWGECDRTTYFDVCKECKNNIIKSFIKQFD